MSITMSMPAALAVPSKRNLEIFELVESGQRSLRAVAEQFGISAGRVQQIVQQVRRWMGKWCDTDERLSPKQRLLQALYLFDERLKRLARAAYEAWEASQGKQTVAKLRDGVRQEVTKTSSGDPRHLTLLLKIEKARLEAAVAVYEQLPKFEEETPKSAGEMARFAPYAPDAELDETTAETIDEQEVLSEGEGEGSEEMTVAETAETLQENVDAAPSMRAEALKLNRKQRRRRLALLKKLKRRR